MTREKWSSFKTAAKKEKENTVKKKINKSIIMIQKLNLGTDINNPIKTNKTLQDILIKLHNLPVWMCSGCVAQMNGCSVREAQLKEAPCAKNCAWKKLIESGKHSQRDRIPVHAQAPPL